MKLPLLLITLLLASSPAFANKVYTAGSFDGKNYVLTFYLVDNTDSLYSVSVVEPRSVRRDGYAVPSAFSFDCRKKKGVGTLQWGQPIRSLYSRSPYLLPLGILYPYWISI